MVDLLDRIKDKNLYVISDLHMGDGSNKDNFKEYLPEFEKFLDYVEKDPDYCLIIAGDVFEFWQSQHGDIIKTYYDLLNRMTRMNSVFVIGNHDIDLIGFIGLEMGCKFFELLSGGLVVSRNGKNIRIMHGHEFDIFNDPNKAMMLGKMAAMLAGWLEMKIGSNIGNESTESFLSNSVMKIVSFFSNIYKILNPTVSEGGDIDKFYQTILDYHKKYPNNILIMGHTHDAGIISDWYFNSGSWQKNSPHFVVVNKSGSIMLRKWPSCEQVFSQLI